MFVADFPQSLGALRGSYPSVKQWQLLIREVKGHKTNPRTTQQTKMSSTSPALGAQPPEGAEWKGLPGTARGHLCSQKSSIRLLPSREQTSFTVSLHLPFLLPTISYNQTPSSVPLPWAAPHMTFPNPQVFPEADLCSPEGCFMPDLLHGSKKIFKPMVENNHHPNPYHLFPHF